MDAALLQALAPVLRDLENSGARRPDIREEQWSDFPASHPLSARMDDDRAVWTCPATGQLICAVGQWPGPGSLGAG